MDYWVKLKDSEKRDKYLDLPWELKKLWNMKVTIMQIVICTLGTVTKCFVQGRVENIQTSALLSSGRILRRVLGI